MRLDSLISPLIRKGQSLHHICISHLDEIMLNERTLYNYVDKGLFSARNIDMPRVVRMGRRKRKKGQFKVDKKCRIGRTYQDFINFMAKHPGLTVVEIDSLEGRKGGKVLLTLHFTIPQLMLAFIRDANTSQTVIDIFDRLYIKLQPDVFKKLFQVLLGDNGSEFSNPLAIERDQSDIQRTRILSHVVQENSATSEESAAASEELSSQAESLNEMVSKYRLKKSFSSNSINELNPEVLKMLEQMAEKKKPEPKQAGTGTPKKSKKSKEAIVLSDSEFGKY